MDLPPILPEVFVELNNYLICLEKLPIHNFEFSQEFWHRKPNSHSLIKCIGSSLSSSLKVQRNLNTGEIIEFLEVNLQGVGETAKNSLSLNRAPAAPNEVIRGNVMNIPFLPASFPDIKLCVKNDIGSNTEMLYLPPGFNRGIKFNEDGRTITKDNLHCSSKSLSPVNNVINILSLLQEEQNILDIWNKSQTKSNIAAESSEINIKTIREENEIIPCTLPILKISQTSEVNNQNPTWAIQIDTSKPVNNFNERIPVMAYNFKFELDTFQKQAILQLEQHNHVFVAAHTSAGKTVVAEYAIALSQKHMTRTIYTSPIKALSNQKYRDFKKVFKDVGLITGDFQINPTAACLIMTTEILRSMLYCGSEVTRDLEYVIFDEVHYINNEERGHVWEQVLILLPPHVCVVLLSATVPNTMEFADWLGHTYQKHVYVVSTVKRPVPLHHYLYTGSGGSTRDNKFLLLDPNGWHTEGYTKAVASFEKKNKQEKYQNANSLNKKVMPKKEPYRSNFEGFTAKQEKTMWYGLVEHLTKNNLLPVVAFTFSRAKCDLNAENLSGLDLTTQKEKAEIHSIFKRCLKILKEPDRQIPQILKMQNILQRGIGVHHSGVLPILKEVVEILFQKELIKLLFATETFAMGVNMPTRTVIFDCIEKHDGKDRRLLHSAEYIQMAGRAGRRGMDKAGTVIILCKNSVPKSQDLQKVMLETPNKLKSQFRLTYGMVLSLLRVESLTVEGMMERSFCEIVHQKDMVRIKEQLKETEELLNTVCKKELDEYLQPLIIFYNYASAYLKLREKCIVKIMDSQNVSKSLMPGRIVLITYNSHINKLALILQITRATIPTYNVLILTNRDANEKVEKSETWYKMLGLASENIFIPVTSPGHKVISITRQDIFEISAKVIKVDVDLVYKDWEKRQIPRFCNDPPGQTCNNAIQELHKLSIIASTEKKYNKLEFMDFIHDLRVTSGELYENVKKLEEIKNKIYDLLPTIQVPNFEDQFSIVFERKFLEDMKEDLQKNYLELVCYYIQIMKI